MPIGYPQKKKKSRNRRLMYNYTLFYTSKLPFIKHEVLTFPSGLATHNHPDKHIVVECVKEAVGSHRIVGRRIIRSKFSETQLLARARALAFHRRYELKYNCEDYIAELFGNSPISKQRNFWLTVGLLGLGLIATR